MNSNILYICNTVTKLLQYCYEISIPTEALKLRWNWNSISISRKASIHGTSEKFSRGTFFFVEQLPPNLYLSALQDTQSWNIFFRGTLLYTICIYLLFKTLSRGTPFRCLWTNAPYYHCALWCIAKFDYYLFSFLTHPELLNSWALEPLSLLSPPLSFWAFWAFWASWAPWAFELSDLANWVNRASSVSLVNLANLVSLANLASLLSRRCSPAFDPFAFFALIFFFII